MNKQNKKIISFPNYINRKFKNYNGWKQPGIIKNIVTILKFLFCRRNRKPSSILPAQNVDLNHFNRNGNDQLNVTWLGHSSLMINIDGYKILTDPVFEKKISFLGPTRYNGKVPTEIFDLPEIDVVLLSHNHYDHLNKYSIQAIKDKVKLFITPLAVGTQLKKWDVPKDKIIELDWWNENKVSEDLTITLTPAQHFSGRGIFDNNKTLWGSFVIQSPNHKIFFSGDSGYFEGFKQIGNKYGPFDITFIECGAYNELWHSIHMFPEETLQAHIDLQGKILHPIHWGTFNLALHPWFEPMERLAAAAEEIGTKIAVPIVGETTVFNTSIPSRKWWEKYMDTPL